MQALNLENLTILPPFNFYLQFYLERIRKCFFKKQLQTSDVYEQTIGCLDIMDHLFNFPL